MIRNILKSLDFIQHISESTHQQNNVSSFIIFKKMITLSVARVSDFVSYYRTLIWHVRAVIENEVESFLEIDFF